MTKIIIKLHLGVSLVLRNSEQIDGLLYLMRLKLLLDSLETN